MTTAIAHNILPSGITKMHVLKLLDALSPVFGFSAGFKDYLRHIVGITSPEHWVSPGSEPVCYEEQSSTAAFLGLSDRCIRKFERQLESLRLGRIATGGGGRRGVFGRDRSVKLGISLQPLIDRYEELEAVANQRTENLNRAIALRHQISAAKRSLSANLARLESCSCDQVQKLQRVKDSLPKRMTTKAHDLETLSSIYQRVKAAAEQAENLAIERLSRNSWADEAEQISRPIKQDSDKNIIESEECYEAMKTPEMPQPDAQTVRRVAASFDLAELMQMAHPDLQAYLAAYMNGQNLTPRTFMEATIAYWGACGFCMHAWERACCAMGDMATALSALVITANTRRRSNPITNPPAMLSRFADLSREGSLNLLGSIHALQRANAAREGA